VQCPALLFPYLRRIIGDLTVDGGYPPLYLDPIDFYYIFSQKKSEDNSNQSLSDNKDVKSVFN
jgi:preprotein translocase subunit SecB